MVLIDSFNEFSRVLFQEFVVYKKIFLGVDSHALIFDIFLC